MYIQSSLAAVISAFQLGDYERAIALVESALKEDPQDPDLHYWLAKARQQKHYEEQAIVEASKVLITTQQPEQQEQEQQGINEAGIAQAVKAKQSLVDRPIAKPASNHQEITSTLPKPVKSLKTKAIISAIAGSTLPVLAIEATAWIFANQITGLTESQLRLALEIGTPVTALLAGGIASLVASRSTRRLMAVSAAVEKLMQGETNTRIAVEGKDELAVLATHINQIADQKDSLLHKTNNLENLVTELKNQQRALDVSAIVSITDRKGLITYTNDKFSEISGYSREELLGQNHRIVNSGHHPKEFFVEVWKVISSGQVWKGEIKNKSKNGSYYWVDSTLMPCYDAKGKISGYIGIRFDITERKQAEEKLKALAEEQERLVQEVKNRQDVLDEAAIVSEADLKGNITFVNDKFCEISGYSREELIGKNHRIVNSGYHSKEFFEDFWKTISSGKVWKGEIKNKRKDGSFYWVDSTVAPIFNEKGKIVKYIGIRFEITEQKVAVENLGKLAEERKQEADFLTQQVKKLLSEIKGAAKGDLTVKAQVTNDICGTLADSFNYLIGSLRKVVINIQDAAGQVNQATATSINNSNEVARQASVQAAQIEETLQQLERMLNSINDVSEAAKRAEQVAEQAAQTAETGGQAVDRTVEGINELRHTIADTSKMMKRLGEGSQQIGKIVTSISQIASQTNLLALNATIEAARAGEQGQGFAVVAEEVRKLAERAASATEEISEIVKTIQDEISRVMAAMESGTQQVVEGTQIAAAAKTNLVAIIEVSREINSLVQNITRAAQKQTISAEEIAGSVKEVNAISTITSQKAEDMTASLDGLAVVVNKLQGSVSNFRSQ